MHENEEDEGTTNVFLMDKQLQQEKIMLMSRKDEQVQQKVNMHSESIYDYINGVVATK